MSAFFIRSVRRNEGSHFLVWFMPPIMLLIVCLLIWNNVPKWNNIPERRIPGNGWMELSNGTTPCSKTNIIYGMLFQLHQGWSYDCFSPISLSKWNHFSARSTLGQVVPGLFHEIWVPIPLCCPSRLLPRSISLSPSCLMEHLLRPNILPPFHVVLRQHKIDENANVNSFFNFSFITFRFSRR